MEKQLKDKQKNKTVYTKDMLVRKIAEQCRRDYTTVRSVYNTLESIVAKVLSSANPDTDITVRLFEGITIDSTYTPEKTKVNNLTGETQYVGSKIKPKVNITRTYCNKLTANSEYI